MNEQLKDALQNAKTALGRLHKEIKGKISAWRYVVLQQDVATLSDQNKRIKSEMELVKMAAAKYIENLDSKLKSSEKELLDALDELKIAIDDLSKKIK